MTPSRARFFVRKSSSSSSDSDMHTQVYLDQLPSALRFHQELAAVDRRLRRGAPRSPPMAQFPRPAGSADDPIMKKLLLLLVPTALTLAACGSSGPTRDASQPLVFVTSQRTPSYITECLESRLSRVHASSVGGATELAVGIGFEHRLSRHTHTGQCRLGDQGDAPRECTGRPAGTGNARRYCALRDLRRGGRLASACCVIALVAQDRIARHRHVSESFFGAAPA